MADEILSSQLLDGFCAYICITLERTCLSHMRKQLAADKKWNKSRGLERTLSVIGADSARDGHGARNGHGARDGHHASGNKLWILCLRCRCRPYLDHRSPSTSSLCFYDGAIPLGWSRAGGWGGESESGWVGGWVREEDRYATGSRGTMRVIACTVSTGAIFLCIAAPKFLVLQPPLIPKSWIYSCAGGRTRSKRYSKSRDNETHTFKCTQLCPQPHCEASSSSSPSSSSSSPSSSSSSSLSSPSSSLL